MSAGSNGGIVQWFHDVDVEDNDVAGGKGANLAALAQAGFPVPRGFVITTTADRDLTDTPDIRDAVGQLDGFGSTDTNALTAVAADLRLLVKRRELDASVDTAISDAMAGFEHADSFAVRSSATAEELGITTSTFHEHLHKAEEKLLDLS